MKHFLSQFFCIMLLFANIAQGMQKSRKSSRDRNLVIPLETESPETQLFNAINSKDISTINSLLTQNKKLLGTTDSQGNTLAHLAVASESVDVVAAVAGYLKNYASPRQSSSSFFSTRNHNKQTPLHFAAALGNMLVIKFLVEQCKANQFKQDAQGMTPLHYAILKDHEPTVLYLLRTMQKPILAEYTNEDFTLAAALRCGALATAKTLLADYWLNLTTQKNIKKELKLIFMAASICKNMTLFEYFYHESRHYLDKDAVRLKLLKYTAQNENIPALEFLIQQYKHKPTKNVRKNIHNS